YSEAVSGQIFIASAITIGVGMLLLTFVKQSSRKPEKKDLFLMTTLTWLLLSFFGALPYVFSYTIPSPVDAWFESVSGFTTTGSSILNNIDALPHGILFWRSLTQWIGGIAILYTAFMVFPSLSIGGMQIFILESPGIKSAKLSPRIRKTALYLLTIYSSLTVLEAIILTLQGMSIFDALCHSFATLSTGGFSTHQAGIAYFNSPMIEYTLIFFMFIAGINYALHFLALNGKIKKAIRNEELKYYIGVILLFTVLITIGLLKTTPKGYEQSFRESLFHVVAILTTTGFYTTNYAAWYPTLWYMLLLLFFIGASVGSTSGSMKLVRIELLLKDCLLEIKRIFNPNAVIPVRFNDRMVPERLMNHVVSFFLSYVLIFITSCIIFSLIEPNMQTAFGTVAASLGNIGPGFGNYGPGHSYAAIHPAGKLLLSFLMLLGRLEIYTILILFTRAFWKR
ncbi:MAG: potassium transporter TrkG, partial [Bacteroidota bacterium]|nr:potassium transporter TrkG [Bacteroidota bacterium]